jgi:hypothetical protein
MSIRSQSGGVLLFGQEEQLYFTANQARSQCRKQYVEVDTSGEFAKGALGCDLKSCELASLAKRNIPFVEDENWIPKVTFT